MAPVTSQNAFMPSLIAAVLLPCATAACRPALQSPGPPSPAAAPLTSTSSPVPTPTPWPTPTGTPTPTHTPRPSPSPLATWDQSTPAPPGERWATYTDGVSGVSFRYPANWFLAVEADGDAAWVFNAPAGSITAAKGDSHAAFISIRVGLRPIDIGVYGSIDGYLASTVLKSLPPQGVKAMEPVGLPQGYEAVRLTTVVRGEGVTLYVANGRRLVSLGTSYPEGRPKQYLYVMERVAESLAIP